jgi:SH3 domain-containing protein
MSKGRQAKSQKRNNPLGCLLLIVAGAFFYFASQSPSNRASNSARSVPAGNSIATITNTPQAGQTRAATATITDTPGFTPEAGAAMTMQPETYTTTGGANLRNCPRRDCDAVDVISAGTAIRVKGVINGESVQVGNAIWYVVEHEGQTAYLYSNLARRGAPAPTSAPVQVQNQPQPTSVQMSVQPQAGASCPDITANCSALTCEQAYACLAAGHSDLDRNKDGVPCESVCGG